MAHAGTPMDLAKQPATTGSSGFWRALVLAIVVVTIAAVLALGAAFAAGAKPAADNSYNRIEDIRGAAPLTVGPVDRSYNAVEQSRGAAPLSVMPVNPTYNAAEDYRSLVGTHPTVPRGKITQSGNSGNRDFDPGKAIHGKLP